MFIYIHVLDIINWWVTVMSSSVTTSHKIDNSNIEMMLTNNPVIEKTKAKLCLTLKFI